MSGHTRGPWGSGNELGYGRQIRGTQVTSVASGLVLAVAIGDVPELDSKANARLIAASPELADCIHDLLYLHIAHHNHPLHVAARALLAKAEGRSDA